MERAVRSVAISLLATRVYEAAVDSGPATASSTPVSGPFTDAELAKLAALNPIDSYSLVRQRSRIHANAAKLDLDVIDIVVARTPEQKNPILKRRRLSRLSRAAADTSS